MAANPGLFRRMAEPFPNVEAANVAVEAFWDEFAALREKHKVTNVYVIVESPYLADDGEETGMCLCGMIGDSQKSEAMTAYAFGRESAKRQENISRIVKAAGILKSMKDKD